MLTEGRAGLTLASHLGHRLLFQTLESFLASFPSLCKYIGCWYMLLLLPTLLSICYHGTIPT